jgi:hypothetical protein
LTTRPAALSASGRVKTSAATAAVSPANTSWAVARIVSLPPALAMTRSSSVALSVSQSSASPTIPSGVIAVDRDAVGGDRASVVNPGRVERWPLTFIDASVAQLLRSPPGRLPQGGGGRR